MTDDADPQAASGMFWAPVTPESIDRMLLDAVYVVPTVEEAAALERQRYEWAQRVVGQHLGPGLEALWQATMAHRDLGVKGGSTCS